jgi:hypothetical protein
MLYNTISLKNPDFLQKTLKICFYGCIIAGHFPISGIVSRMGDSTRDQLYMDILGT